MRIYETVSVVFAGHGIASLAITATTTTTTTATTTVLLIIRHCAANSSFPLFTSLVAGAVLSKNGRLDATATGG